MNVVNNYDNPSEEILLPRKYLNIEALQLVELFHKIKTDK